MNETLVLMPAADLREMISEAVRSAVGEQPPELWTTAQLAKDLGVSPDLVRLWVRDEGCPHVRVGQKKLRFRRSDVIQWLETRERR